MSYAPISEMDTGRIAGGFKEAEVGKWFEYSRTMDGEASPFGPEFSFKVWVQDGQSFRWAKVMRTVAYVVVDEGADGSPVTERWEIRSGSHREYN